MQRILTLLLICWIPIIGISQTIDNSTKKTKTLADNPYQKMNVVKFNIASLAFRNPTFFYERAIKPRLTGIISVGLRYKGESMALFTTNDNEIELNLGSIGGISIAPEIRYYLKSCCNDDFPTGFYGGVYLKYTHMNSDVDINYYPAEGETENVNGDFTLNEKGVGIQLGYQLKAWKNFSVDFQFFGPRISFINLKGDFSNDISDEFRDDLEEYVNDVIARLGSDYKFNVKDKGANSISGNMSIPSFRFGISIGYAF